MPLRAISRVTISAMGSAASNSKLASPAHDSTVPSIRVVGRRPSIGLLSKLFNKFTDAVGHLGIKYLEKRLVELSYIRNPGGLELRG